MQSTRREFLAISAMAAAGLTAGRGNDLPAQDRTNPALRLGLVTYNWGRAWDIPQLIESCEQTQFEGVELRSTHKHGVEISLNKQQRKEVAARFKDTPVELVGLGSACEYHSPDPNVLKKNIEQTKAFVKLCHDVGGKGVKVRPNGISRDVGVTRTIRQIGKALREVATFAEDYGVKIRLEVHGRESCRLHYIRKMMDAAKHSNAVVCWNCNQQDMIPNDSNELPETEEGRLQALRLNYAAVKDKIEIIHIHDLRNKSYPWKELFRQFRKSNFTGWTLLEEGKVPGDVVAAMKENRKIWESLSMKSQRKG